MIFIFFFFFLFKKDKSHDTPHSIFRTPMGDSESNKFSRQGSDMSIRKDLWAPVYFYFYYFNYIY